MYYKKIYFCLKFLYEIKIFKTEKEEKTAKA